MRSTVGGTIYNVADNGHVGKHRLAQNVLLLSQSIISKGQLKAVLCVKNEMLMKTLFPKIFLGLMTLAFCKTGIESLIDPQAVLAQVGIVLDNPSALSSMRAVYGGLHLVIGLFCFWGIFKTQETPLIFVLLYTVGFIAGRLSGILVDGAPNSFVMTWLITEMVAGAMAGYSLYLLRKVPLTVRTV